MKTFSSVVIATLTMVGMASAQPKAGAKVDAKAAAPVAKADPKGAPAPQEMTAPTPAPELKEMLKMSAGTWKCTGTMGPEMQSAPMKATLKTKSDLDGFWIQDVFEGTMGKMKFKFVSHTTFDASSKKWRRVMVDNMGSQMIGTADGLKDGKITFNMDTMGGGPASMFKDSVDLTNPKAPKSWGEMSMDKGKTWQKVYEMTCKK